ncbi:MAG: hypothetical protein HC875_04050, partial [Anaerolineales bacterium]|nr:hypothetical protein [Anaerolineales bacterium]
MKPGQFCFLLLILLLVLAGCGDNRPPNQPDFQPIRPDAATAPAIATPVASQPTSVIPVGVGLSNFTHPSQRFSISYPETWQPFERPDGVVFIDPGDAAGYGVFFNDAGQVYSEKDLNQ